MPFDLVTRDDLSLADLVRMHQAGASVLKTPHVGNIYPNNLAIAMLGLPLVLVDRTIGHKDRNFHPHQLIHERRAEVVAPGDVLTTHAKIVRTPSRFAERFTVGARVMDAHMKALREALPHADLMTETERQRRDPEFFSSLFETLHHGAPHAWERYVREDGVVMQRKPTDGWKQICDEGIHGLVPDHANGWITPNIWALIADAVSQWRLRGTSQLFELSGPDMVIYIGKHQEELHQCYHAVRQHLFPALPETMTCVIVPVAEMRLIVPVEQRAALEALVDAYLSLGAFRVQTAEQMRGLTVEARATLSLMITEKRYGLNTRLRETVQACPDLVYNIRHASYLSQYDMLTGTKFFIHPWGVETPMREIIAFMKVIDPQRLRERN